MSEQKDNAFLDSIYEAFPEAELLSEGGQKTVLKATHPEFGEVVIKIGEYELDSSLERISREVGILQEIRSPFYPIIYDYTVNHGKKKFIIIEEWIDSVPLSDKIAKFEDKRETFKFIRELVEGLRILWNMRIVHRDIKPPNILITKEGKIKIIDLGIARVLDAESLTETALLIGPCTPIYASPEQIQNMKLEIDWRSDQFNLGIITGQLLYSGVHPFSPELASGESIVSNILSGNWAKECLAKLDERCQLILTKMLGVRRHMRFRTPDMLIRELDKYLMEG